MRGTSGIAAIAIGFILLWAVTHGYTKNLNSAWNSLIGAGSMGPFVPPVPLPKSPGVPGPGSAGGWGDSVHGGIVMPGMTSGGW